MDYPSISSFVSLQFRELLSASEVASYKKTNTKNVLANFCRQQVYILRYGNLKTYMRIKSIIMNSHIFISVIMMPVLFHLSHIFSLLPLCLHYHELFLLHLPLPLLLSSSSTSSFAAVCKADPRHSVILPINTSACFYDIFFHNHCHYHP